MRVEVPKIVHVPIEVIKEVPIEVRTPAAGARILHRPLPHPKPRVALPTRLHQAPSFSPPTTATAVAFPAVAGDQVR